MRMVTSYLWHLCLRVEGGFGSALCHMTMQLESQEPFSTIIILTLLCVSRGTISIGGSDEKRYAELFRACLRKHNNDCNLQYSVRGGLKITKEATKCSGVLSE